MASSRRKPPPPASDPAPAPASPATQRITLHIPVSVALSEDDFRDAQAVNEALGVAARIARTPEVREVARNLFEAARRRFAKP